MSEHSEKLNVYKQNSSKPEIHAELTNFSFKANSDSIGYGNFTITGLIPGVAMKLRGITYFAPMDPDDESDKGRCRYPNTKDEKDEWVSRITFVDLDTPASPSKTHYRILSHCCRAVREYLDAQNVTTPANQPSEPPITDDAIPF
jgi:hypothetical protein